LTELVFDFRREAEAEFLLQRDPGTLAGNVAQLSFNTSRTGA